MQASRPVIIAVLMLLASFQLSSQDRKAQRMERREERREVRRLERAVRDSLRMRQMEEDSINIGYGYIRKRNLTSSVSQVSVRQQDLSGYTNIGEYLRGRVPGLVVSKVGGSYKYTIRGANSIYASTDPLFVVDGAVVMDIDFLNPRDVKSVEVLKDASASIYGTRGACGVILITTRKTAD